jgi:trimethylamine--corrinoid protein Co-methyltransferase
MREKVERIHASAMAILKKVGIKIHLPGTCRLLKKHGIKMDQEVAYFAEEQVMDWVRKAPTEFTLCARNPDHNARIGGGQAQYAAGHGCAQVLDANTRRAATLADYIRFVQLVHQSAVFNINGGILVQPSELTAGRACHRQCCPISNRTPLPEAVATVSSKRSNAPQKRPGGLNPNRPTEFNKQQIQVVPLS